MTLKLKIAYIFLNFFLDICKLQNHFEDIKIKILMTHRTFLIRK